VAGTKIDEAFIGSCMTNIGHFRAAAKLLKETAPGAIPGSFCLCCSLERYTLQFVRNDQDFSSQGLAALF
jgi:aconitase B